VTIRAHVKRHGETIATYETIGSFHAEDPVEPGAEELDELGATMGRAIQRSNDRVMRTVNSSWEHAFALLVAKIKLDRARIAAALTSG
jgi:hypothetical protein